MRLVVPHAGVEVGSPSTIRKRASTCRPSSSVGDDASRSRRIRGRARCRAFSDPFYSPGSDFITTECDFVTDLIAREARGEAMEEPVRLYDEWMQYRFDTSAARGGAGGDARSVRGR